MDTGVASKPATGVAAQSYVPSIVIGPDPTATELPASKAVTPSTATTPARNDAPTTKDETIIDQQTREVIYRVIDLQSGQVVRQVPDEALLRTRAYAQALANGDTPFQANQADVEV
jgi:flagellar protein FlaG